MDFLLVPAYGSAPQVKLGDRFMDVEDQRFLLFKDYDSGFSNEVMSIELAVGLAQATERTLVLYGDLNDEGRLRNFKGRHAWHAADRQNRIIDNRRVPSILQLLDDLPVAQIDYRTFLDVTRERALSRYDCYLPLIDSYFVNQAGPHEDMEAFANGRWALLDSDHDIVHHFRANLGYFSHFFYSPTPELMNVLARVRLREPFRSLASAVASSLGSFNGLHVRLTDFRKAMGVGKLFPDDADYGRAVADTLCEHFATEETLVISTDEPGADAVFNQIRDRFPRTIMTDDLLMGPFAPEFQVLPFRDEVTFAAICQAILFGAKDFIGAPHSTFSGLIHRTVHARPELRSAPFKYSFSGFDAETCAFDSGIYTEVGEGPYSWNRLRMPASEGQKSWMREWPEALEPRRVDPASLSSVVSRRGAMINVALGRQARQSSFSEWSHPHDANRAVSGWNIGQFAFHTDFEDSPWWEVDLGLVHAIDQIVISNRREHCQARARTLSVTLRSTVDGSEQVVYKRADSFQGLADDVPLVIQLDAQPARFVRIQLHEHNALHLRQVQIFVQPKNYLARLDGSG